MIEIQCPDCERVLKVPEKYVGTEGACNYCGGRVQVQAPQRHEAQIQPSAAPAAPEEVKTLTAQLAEARDEIQNLSEQLQAERAANTKNTTERDQASTHAAELEAIVARAQERERELAPRADLEKAQKELAENREFAEWLGAELETSRDRAKRAEKMLKNARAKLLSLADELAEIDEKTDEETEKEAKQPTQDTTVMPDDAAAAIIAAPAAKQTGLWAWLIGAGIGFVAAIAAFGIWILHFRQ